MNKNRPSSRLLVTTVEYAMLIKVKMLTTEKTEYARMTK